MSRDTAYHPDCVDNPYVASIRAAEKRTNANGRPLIRYASEEFQRTLGVDIDAYGHVDTPDVCMNGLSQTNTRELSDPARWLLTRNVGQVRERARVLFLGAGSGLECAQAKRLRPDLHVLTQAFSPMDPFRMPLLEFSAMQDAVRALQKDRTWQRDDVAKALMARLARDIHTLPPSAMTRIDAYLPNPVFFQHVEEPFIEEQLMGPFPDVSPDGSFDVVYDSCGPFRKIGGRTFLTTLRDMRSRLEPDGALIIDTLPTEFSPQKERFGALLDTVLPQSAALVDRTRGALIVSTRRRVEAILGLRPAWSEGWAKA